MKVHWIVTGALERHALPQSLARLFPELESDTPQAVDSVTSCDVTITTPNVASRLQRFAAAIVFAADPGRDAEPPDLVVAVDDVELVNRHQPERIVANVREAVRAQIDCHYPSATRRERTRSIVSERCSFHLFGPMVEAYFFGEAEALRRAGARREALLARERDLEDFETVDPAYLATPSAPSQAARHPKRYLEHLCAPDEYKETRGGRRALEALDWPLVMRDPTATRLARSLHADLRWALGHGLLAGEVHPATGRFGHRENVLRNC